MPAKLLKISYPVPSDKNGHEFSSAEQLLSLLGSENSGQYLVGSQGMWHGGIHITDATVPWCALSADTAAEREYLAKNAPYKGGQFIRCMAEGKIVAWRVCKDYDSAAIAWRDGHVFQSTSFVLVEHYIQPGEKDSSGLTFHTLYMNMAPFEAYITEEGANQRKVAKSQRYYASKEDVLASPAKPAGTLPGGTAVTLSDNLITRGSDRRQFTQVTLSAEAKNTAGKKLAAGTPVWTVSDQGSLLAASSAVPVPSWWTKCSPAYGNQTGAGVQCTARANWQFYLSSDDVLKGNNAGSLTAGFPLTYEPDNAGQQMTRPAKNKNEAARIFSLVTLGRNAGKMKKGDRVWVVSDGDSLTKTAQAAAGGEPKFGEVVIPAAPVEINAGDSIGHMGFYELPEEDGKQSRYQVHIECLSMDSKLPTFLTNPDKVGGDSPTFLKYPEGANLFAGNAEGAMVDTKRVTRAPGILTLSGVPVIRADEVVTHYQIRPEGGWLPAANIIKLPQWALGDLGFVTLDSKPESFDLIDGKKQPNNVVKGILAEMYKAAKADPRTGSALYHYNYERLLKQIDRNSDGQFSEEEYIQAIRLPAYRDHLYRIIAKHPSEWWYGKDDALWKKYLDTLVKDAPSWKTYLETFIDRLTWMKSVAGMGPDPWHMHPVVFLDALVPNNDEMDLKWLEVPKGQLTFDVEGNDIENSSWFSRKVHWPGGASGITIGRGYDLGQQSNSNLDLSAVRIGEPLKSWLVASQMLSSTQASDRLNSASDAVRVFQITRKQQYDLFVIVYQRLEDDVKRISQKRDSIRTYHPNPDANPEQAWSDIPDKIKEMLADLRYRGDYTPGIRTHIQRLAYSGDILGFGRVLADRSYWPNVPAERFQRRVSYYENE